MTNSSKTKEEKDNEKKAREAVSSINTTSQASDIAAAQSIVDSVKCAGLRDELLKELYGHECKLISNMFFEEEEEEGRVKFKAKLLEFFASLEKKTIFEIATSIKGDNQGLKGDKLGDELLSQLENPVKSNLKSKKKPDNAKDIPER